MKKSLKRYFITGLLIVVPLSLTIYVFTLVVRLMDSFLLLLPPQYRPEAYLPFTVPGLGLVITVLAIFLIGVVGANFFGRKLVGIGEAILERIPILRAIYKASKQFLETFFAKDGDGFRRVILFEYPRKGLYTLAFVTGKCRGELGKNVPEDALNIFVPTTPNPTSGFYLMVPEKDVTPLSLSVEDAFKVIMTAGMVIPEMPGGVTEEPFPDDVAAEADVEAGAEADGGSKKKEAG